MGGFFCLGNPTPNPSRKREGGETEPLCRLNEAGKEKESLSISLVAIALYRHNGNKNKHIGIYEVGVWICRRVLAMFRGGVQSTAKH
jgi:hypothetical protein